jgi:6-phosphofructokinase
MTIKRIGILVGGGPAPGINSVIGAATIRSILGGAEVLGIMDGFTWLMEGDTSKIRPLSIEEVSRIHFRGGSYLRTARANPTKNAQHLETAVNTLLELKVSGLITIGGDDTAFSALRLEQAAAGRLKVVHVPKTIDNDLDLPHGIPTFGFQTARHIGAEIVKNLMVDAQTTTRWYLVVAMGRKAGHLALGIGKAAGATLTLIPEEFGPGPLRLTRLVGTLVGAIIKRRAMGRADGVAVLAEGLVEQLDPRDLDGFDDIERDEHGHLRLAEVDFGALLKREVEKQLKVYGIKATIAAKNIGYELRCADPIPYDMEYTRDLGYCAANYLLEGGSATMVAMINGRFTPIPFHQILDPVTGRTRVRMVDVESETYRIAGRYMIRLSPEDFAQPDQLAQYAALTGISKEEFCARFEYLVAK